MSGRVLVAGGAGFLGSHLCRALCQEGFEVTCLDNLLTGREANIADLLGRRGFSFIKEDTAWLRDGQGTETIGPLDYIFHLASPASPRDYTTWPLETLLANAMGTYNLLQLARHSKARFVLASTSEVYGSPLIHPQLEDYWGNVNPVGVRSCYDEGKRYAEALSMAYFRQGLDVRVVRIFNTYGPGMRGGDGRVIPNFLSQAHAKEPLTIYGDGRQTRSFCYVSDLVVGLQAAMFTRGVSGEVLNLGNPEEVTILELAQLIKRLTGSPSELKFLPGVRDDPPRRCPDIRRANRLLGWKPTISLEEGLTRMLPGETET
ncbi:MAG: SDR family oxidoreductase [Firmicutes bacterium]|nr:SDR family oxidoreductase [Bacillota bacterium]MCL5040614.1 SDR family oxidoreductase [Bacillota bacterium]